MPPPTTAIHNNGAGNQNAAFGNGDINTVGGQGYQSIVHNHHHWHFTETQTGFKSPDKDLCRECLAKSPIQQLSEQQGAPRRHQPSEEAGQGHHYDSENSQSRTSSQHWNAPSSSEDTLSEPPMPDSWSPTASPHASHLETPQCFAQPPPCLTASLPPPLASRPGPKKTRRVVKARSFEGEEYKKKARAEREIFESRHPRKTEGEVWNIGDSQGEATKQHDQFKREAIGMDAGYRSQENLPCKTPTDHAFDAPMDPPRIPQGYHTPMHTAPCDKRCSQSTPTRKRLSLHSNDSSDSLDQESSPDGTTVGSGNVRDGHRQVFYLRQRSFTRMENASSHSLGVALIPLSFIAEEPRKRTKDRAIAHLSAFPLRLVSRRGRRAATHSRQGNVAGVLVPTPSRTSPENLVGASPVNGNATVAYDKYEFKFKFTFHVVWSRSKMEISSATEVARFRSRKDT